MCLPAGQAMSTSWVLGVHIDAKPGHELLSQLSLDKPMAAYPNSRTN